MSLSPKTDIAARHRESHSTLTPWYGGEVVGVLTDPGLRAVGLFGPVQEHLDRTLARPLAR
ncbi:hypothetical protein ACIGBL_34530 [Streptomyces sp. NPDC085614]|uniref:hypothetical protein n=1 Tax=Streptomyces sp. NPDC085614 TaxID=3365733 RepID=UPI0037CE82B7